MCGLIAILDYDRGGWISRAQAAKAVLRGMGAMERRGLPGDFDYQSYGKGVYGHVRLPMINLTDAAAQPMFVNHMLVMLVGEIFNYQDLVAGAECDTQAMGEIYDREGLEAFHRFDGFWAAVFADTRKVVVVTDYLSQKPLYFHSESLLVASEPRAIVEALGPKRKPRLDDLYFSNVMKWGYDPTGNTPYEGIVQISPGAALTYAAGGFSVQNYWDWESVPYEKDLAGLLIEATRNRLIGDREVAMLLSGGLDSTIVFKILTKVLGQHVKVFHAENSEEEFLQAALDGYASKQLVVPPASVEAALHAHQVPVDLGSMVPQFGLAQAIRKEGFYAAMSGDGADELFGGYRRAQEYDSQWSDTFVELPLYHHPRLDRVMMAQTVELRTPYLAPKVVRHALELPWHKRQSKEALKSAFQDLVPQVILDRAKLPLKTAAVSFNPIRYRKELIDLWKRNNA